MKGFPFKRTNRSAQLIILLALCSVIFNPVNATGQDPDPELENFKTAWEAARRGDHDSFRKIMPDLQDYVLYPYLQYEDYRNRRGSVASDEMAAFLESNRELAFAGGLRHAWLKSLAKRGRWADLLTYSVGVTDTVLRCQRARAKIILKDKDGLLEEAQNLWTVGKSQPDECDHVFDWLIRNDGIPSSLAWERIRLAMIAGNPRMTVYLARFIPKSERRWLENWQRLSRNGYSSLEKASGWPDRDYTRMITAVSIRRLARKDAPLAAKKFKALDGHFNWGETRRATLLRDIALYSAVDLVEDTTRHMERVSAVHRDSQLLEWWARFLLSRDDWQGLISVIEQMPEDTRNDERWLYWLAQAELRAGLTDKASVALEAISERANYYGFLAADELNLPYSICPLQPDVSEAEIDRIAALDGFRRALELRKAGLDNWAVSEWTATTSHLPAGDLRAAAALAQREGWHDRVIFALGNSGDLRYYEWRFPLLWEQEIKKHAGANKLDPAWVYGTIRSESAMVETARSSANALGLMQVTPATGKRVARKNGLPWNGSSQLKEAQGNLPIGTAYMRDLLQDYQQNPVLVSGAYNAGPNAVQRWLDKRPAGEAAIWIETLPYFETRDYIPRVLAFTTIYDWRMDGKAQRISGRMPHIESGKIGASGSTDVLCRE